MSDTRTAYYRAPLERSQKVPHEETLARCDAPRRVVLVRAGARLESFESIILVGFRGESKPAARAGNGSICIRMAQ